jgi:ribose 5-phosphate isomerase RpiB
MITTFTRSESWHDYRGTHNCTTIFKDKKEIGTIEGDTGCGGMRYAVIINGVTVAEAWSLKDAKSLTRQHLEEKTNA